MIESINDEEPVTYNLRWCIARQTEGTSPSITPSGEHGSLFIPRVARIKAVGKFEGGEYQTVEKVVIERFVEFPPGKRVHVKLYSGSNEDSRCWYNAIVVKASPSEAMGVEYEVKVIQGVTAEIQRNTRRALKKGKEKAGSDTSNTAEENEDLEDVATGSPNNNATTAPKRVVSALVGRKLTIARQDTHGGSFASRLQDDLWGATIHRIPYERIREIPKPKFKRFDHVEVEFDAQEEIFDPADGTTVGKVGKTKDKDSIAKRKSTKTTAWFPAVVETVDKNSSIAGGIEYTVRYFESGKLEEGISAKTNCTRRRLRYPFIKGSTAEFYLIKGAHRCYTNSEQGWRKCVISQVRRKRTVTNSSELCIFHNEVISVSLRPCCR